MTSYRAGRHFLQIPGPTNVPDQVLQSMAQPTIDHRSAEFAALTRELLAGLQHVFKNSGHVVLYPSSGTGAWEAALTNTLSPGDKVLAVEIGEFSRLWAELGKRLGLDVEIIETDWTRAVDPALVEQRLSEDRGHAIKAVLVVHNETSTGAMSQLAKIRQAIDRTHHPALYFVDAVSSLCSMDLRQDEWGIDIVVTGSQKGLMLPPGIGFNSISAKALAAAQHAGFTKGYWAWGPIIALNAQGFFPYTPPTNLLYGLRESLRMLQEEGLEQVFKRHHRLASATRAAVKAWGLEILCRCEDERSDSVTTVMLPAGHNSDAFRQIVLERFNMSLGTGLGKLKGRAFRIGHLGDFNELMLMGTLSGVEMGLQLAGVPFTRGGVLAAMQALL